MGTVLGLFLVFCYYIACLLVSKVFESAESRYTFGTVVGIIGLAITNHII
jgi:hypothetical protein